MLDPILIKLEGGGMWDRSCLLLWRIWSVGYVAEAATEEGEASAEEATEEAEREMDAVAAAVEAEAVTAEME